MFELYGNLYGGWVVDLELIPQNSTIISAGVGEDISFDLAMIEKRNVNVIGIDPTKKSHDFIEKTKPKNFQLIKKALWSKKETITLYKNRIDAYVSESVLESHSFANKKQSYQTDTITLPELLEKHKNVSVIKMDVEGAEYEVIESLTELSVPQLCVEFHHFCSNKTLQDTINAINKLKELGYNYRTPKGDPNKLLELTFVHKTAFS